MKTKTSVLRQSTRILKTLQEFVDTNPNEVTTLADSALLMEAICAELSEHEVESVN